MKQYIYKYMIKNNYAYKGDKAKTKIIKCTKCKLFMLCNKEILIQKNYKNKECFFVKKEDNEYCLLFEKR